METFTDERQYNSWLIHNDPGGFVLHRTPDGFTLHKAGCEHIAPGYGDDITKNPKYCSDSKHELMRYAKQESEEGPEHCRTCGS